MTDEIHTIVPAIVPEPIEVQVARLRRLIEGYVDKDDKRHLGLLEMTTELYEELKLRRERRDSLERALASGGVLAFVGIGLAWLKDHLR